MSKPAAERVTEIEAHAFNGTLGGCRVCAAVTVCTDGPPDEHSRSCQVSVIPDLLAIYKRQLEWISDLQSGLYINCVYCGHRYGPEGSHAATVVDGLPMAQALKAHIEECPEHPMSRLRDALAARDATIIRLRGVVVEMCEKIETHLGGCEYECEEHTPEGCHECQEQEFLDSVIAPLVKRALDAEVKP